MTIPVEGQLCGLHAFSVVTAYLERPISWVQLVATLRLEAAPYSVDDLTTAAESYGFDAYAARWRVRGHAAFYCPAVLLLRRTDASTQPDHFVACLGGRGDELCVVDFPGKPKLVPMDKVMKYWDGMALYIDHPNGSVIPPMRRRHRMVKAAQVVLVLIGCVALVFFVRSALRQSRVESASG